MNKLESSFANYLESIKRDGGILWWAFEGVKLKIATGQKEAWFTPDFCIMTPSFQLVFYETKGFWREAARLRIKVAAGMYPHWRFVAVKRVAGRWEYESFSGEHDEHRLERGTGTGGSH